MSTNFDKEVDRTVELLKGISEDIQAINKELETTLDELRECLGLEDKR